MGLEIINLLLQMDAFRIKERDTISASHGQAWDESTSSESWFSDPAQHPGLCLDSNSQNLENRKNGE